jgi:hypothetical protein
VREPGQHSEHAEAPDRSDGECAAEPIEQRARDAHRGERSQSDEKQCQPELSVRDSGMLLDRQDADPTSH